MKVKNERQGNKQKAKEKSFIFSTKRGRSKIIFVNTGGTCTK